MASEDVKPTGVDFGVILAFVAPGFVALHAASYQIHVAGHWLRLAQNKEQNVGVFLFAFLASLSLGLIVSGVRALVVDNLLECRSLWGDEYAVPKSDVRWEKMSLDRLAVIVTIRDNYLRYYQFYANTAVALLSWFIARGMASRPGVPALGCSMGFVGFVVIVMLVRVARDELYRYRTAVREFLAGCGASGPALDVQKERD